VNIESPLSNPGTDFSVAVIDTYVIAGGTISVGDVLPLPASSIVTAGNATGVTTASAAQRKASTVCVALKAGVSLERIPVRIQGRVQALVKSTGNNAIAVGDRLCFGTVKALEADAPTVNTNRWQALADEAFAAGSSSTAALKFVILMGPPGLGIQGSGT
jgi:hypothetical protein